MADLTVKVTADTRQAQRSVGQLNSSLESTADQFVEIGKVSGIAFAGLSAGIGLVVNQFAQFDNQLRSVRTLLNEASFGAKGLEQGFAELRQGILQVGASVPVGIESLNKSLFDTISAGVNAGQAIDVVNASARLAVAGLTDVAIATDGLTTAINAFGIDAGEADLVAAKFFEAQRLGKTTIEELAGSIGLVAAQASSAGISFEELLAAVTAATTGGIRTNAAFTGLRAAIDNISKPTAEARREAERLGIQFDFNALQTKGLSGVLSDLTSASGFTEESLVRLFGSVEARGLVLSLAGSQADTFRQALTNLNNEQQAGTTFSEAFGIQSESLSSQFALLGNQFQVVAIQIGKRLAPVIGQITQSISGLLTFIQQNPALVDFAASATLTVTALAGLGTALGAAGLAFRGLSIASRIATAAFVNFSVATRLLIGATGLGLLVILANEIFQNWNKIFPALQGLFLAFTRNIIQLASGLSDVLIGLVTFDIDQIQAGLEQAKQAFTQGLADIRQSLRDENETQEEEDKLQREGQFLSRLEEEQEQADILAEQRGERQETEKQARDDAAAQELADLKKAQAAIIAEQKKANDDRLREQLRFGRAFADINRVIQSEQVQGVKQATGELVALQQSSNNQLKAIGKAAAVAQITIKTAESAMNIYAGFSTIPIIGPALGIAGAAAAIAFGAEQIGRVLSAQEGGLVTGGIPGRDSVPALLTPGELVVPQQNFEEVVSAVSQARGNVTGAEEETIAGDESERVSEVLIGFDGDEASQVITARQNEDRALGISRESI